jgi:hypothetical protein
MDNKSGFESEHKHGGTTTEKEKEGQHQSGHREPGQTSQQQDDQFRKHDQPGKHSQQGKHDQDKGGQGEQHHKN